MSHEHLHHIFFSIHTDLLLFIVFYVCVCGCYNPKQGVSGELISELTLEDGNILMYMNGMTIAILR